VAPNTAFLRRGSRGYFRSESCTDGESMAARCVNRSLPPIKAEHEAGQGACTVFQVFGMTRPGIEPILPALEGRDQLTVPPSNGNLSFLHSPFASSSDPDIIEFVCFFVSTRLAATTPILVSLLPPPTFVASFFFPAASAEKRKSSKNRQKLFFHFCILSNTLHEPPVIFAFIYTKKNSNHKDVKTFKTEIASPPNLCF